jgi:hypothetical protein
MPIQEPAIPETPTQPIQFYSGCHSFILQDEFDVLPVACGLAQGYDKVVCYVTNPLPSLPFISRLVGVKHLL